MKTLFIVLLFEVCNTLQSAGESGPSSTYVWICTGRSAYSYHSNQDCSGLNRCKASIQKVTIEKAKSMKRTPCNICY